MRISGNYHIAEALARKIDSLDKNDLHFLFDSGFLYAALMSKADDDQLKEEYLNKGISAVSKINKWMAKYNLSQSIPAGYISLGYLASFMNSEAGVLKNFLNQVNEVIVNNSLQLIKYYWGNNENLKVEYYDVLHGATAMGRYLLKAEESEAYQVPISEILNYLIYLTQGKELKCVKNNFYISPHNIGPFKNINDFPNGFIDLGMAHGTAGVLSFLGIALREGIEVENQRQAIKNLIEIYKKLVVKDGGKIKWPQYIAVDDRGSISPKYGSKASWCYGSLGINRALYIASKATCDQDGEKLALDSMMALCKLDISELGFHCPSFCHGFSGAKYIADLFYRDTGIQIFKNFSDKVHTEILSHYNQDHMYLFKKYDDNSETKEIIIKDSLSIIDGATSIMCSLLLSGEENSFISNMFMID